MGGGQVKIWREPGYVYVRNSRGQNLTAHRCLEGWPVYCIPRFTGPYDEYFAANLSGSHFLDLMPSQIFDELFPDSQHADTPPDTQPIGTHLHGDSHTIADTPPDNQLHSDSHTIADTPD